MCRHAPNNPLAPRPWTDIRFVFGALHLSSVYTLRTCALQMRVQPVGPPRKITEEHCVFLPFCGPLWHREIYLK